MSAPRKLKAVVTGFKRYMDNITLFRFMPEFPVKFRPGQFLHLALDNYDPSFNWPESRVFSIANAPGKEYIDILVSPKGWFTRRMIDEISVDRQIWIKLPYGEFNFNESVGKDVFLIAGGTGISPYISFLDDIIVNKKISYKSINLFYGVRDPDLIVFGENIINYQKEIKGFTYRLFCENINSFVPLIYEKGILQVKEIVDQTASFSDPVFYLSGPKVMIGCFTNELNDKGIDSDRIFYDKWE